LLLACASKYPFIYLYTCCRVKFCPCKYVSAYWPAKREILAGGGIWSFSLAAMWQVQPTIIPNRRPTRRLHKSLCLPAFPRQIPTAHFSLIIRLMVVRHRRSSSLHTKFISPSIILDFCNPSIHKFLRWCTGDCKGNANLQMIARNLRRCNHALSLLLCPP
jgi:hypothetical protein